MPEIELSPGVAMFYQDDDFTDPWRRPEAMLMLHGFAESGVSFNAWVPQLARRFRVIRPDLRGFGRSTPMPADYPWSVEGIIDDLLRLMDHLGIDRFHLVGSRIGGGIAIRFAVAHPERVRTLAVTGASFVSGERIAWRPHVRRAEFEREGVEAWARATMSGRLGSDCDPEMFEGWIQLMSETATSTAAGYISELPGIDNVEDLPRLACPTLVIMIEQFRAGLVDATRARMAKIPRGELIVVPGDGHHVAVTHPDACVRALLDFLERQGVATT
jgi:3-oxoadipate enol-lactonase